MASLVAPAIRGHLLEGDTYRRRQNPDTPRNLDSKADATLANGVEAGTGRVEQQFSVIVIADCDTLLQSLRGDVAPASVFGMTQRPKTPA